MKQWKNISIKIKVMLPICVLGIIVLFASVSSLVNSKRLLDAGVVISQDCSKSIELLMDMSAELESMGKNTPFNGWSVNAQVKETIVDGKTVWKG